MPRSREIPEEIRRQVVEAHKAGKGYKLISKTIGLSKTTVRAILRKWKKFGTIMTLPRSGRPSKLSLKTRQEIIREVMRNPCTTSKDLQATLALSNISIHHSTIRRILGIHRRPTMSSFEDIMPLQRFSQGEEGTLAVSEELIRDVKEEQVWNNNTDTGGTNKAKSCDNGDDASENHSDEMTSAIVNGACHGDVEAASTSTSTNNNNNCEKGAGIKSEKCKNHGNDGAQTTLTIPNCSGGADTKHDY